MKLPGFYVDGRYYGAKLAQAVARAKFIATDHRRNVDIVERNGDGGETLFRTVVPHLGVLKVAA